MDYVIEYDRKNSKSIEAYSQRLIGKSFREIIEEDKKTNHVADDKENKKKKGNLGEIVEEYFFHYECNNDSRPDFHEAGVELKVTPYKIGANGKISAKERLVLTMIDYFAVVNEDFENSHLWAKSRLILLVYYCYQKDIKQNIDNRISYSRLFTPSEQDKIIIKSDYEKIVKKIKEGKAHELSEGDTLYLGACTKASTSKDRRRQPFSDELAKPRAFSFKTTYMTYVLNNYIIKSNSSCETILDEKVVDSFEEFVTSKIDSYRGYTVEKLCDIFNVDVEKKPKNLEAMLAYRMLGIKGNKAEEFEKANIVVKTIRVGNNGKIKESMSFPSFKFKELIQENWDDSTFGNYLRETRFFFVVYKFDEEGRLILSGSQFWNMPYDDLENEVRKVWEKTVDVLKNGLQVTEKNGVKYNNFPKASENAVSHVRPHAQNSKDTYELPDGREYPKQCFWLNNSYILSQLNEKLR